MQALPLTLKIDMSKRRIKEWYEYWEGRVYVSFSGGKDSTVLLHLVRSLYPEVVAVFIDTGLEYPEIRNFVKTIDNVMWIKPEMNFKQVIRTYGYPVGSKEIACKISAIKRGLPWGIKLINKIKSGNLVDKNGNPSPYGISKRWLRLLDDDCNFNVTNQCCSIMKKRPFKKYEKETNKKPFIGTMACESMLRTAAWMKTGCNAFEGTVKQSKPLSFWTENDVLQYVKQNNIQISSVYGEIIETEKTANGIYEDVVELTTTKCKRTGCMFCLFGIQCEKNPNRLQVMQKTHPKQYEYMLRPIDDGDLG